MLDFIALFLLFLGKLKVKALLFLLLLHLGGKSAPAELNRNGALVDDLEVLVAEERD